MEFSGYGLRKVVWKTTPGKSPLLSSRRREKTA